MNWCPLACSVCFGDPSSAMSQGLTMGVVALVAVTGAVLTAFAVFFIRLGARAKAAAPKQADD